MKKMLIIIILFAVCSTNGQTDDVAKIKELNQQMLIAYRDQKFDDALKLVKKTLEISLKIYGADNVETATSYINVGVIQREKARYGESVENLQKALEIYEKQSKLDYPKIIEITQLMARSQFLDGKKKEAEASLLKGLEISETKLGSENKVSFRLNLDLANLSANYRNFEKADVYYLKSYSLAKKIFGDEGKEVDQVTDSRECLSDDNKERDKAFKKEFNLIFGISDLPDGFIINGKALSLVKPPYPAIAKSQRLIAKIKVRVNIDESGNVLSAKAICGASVFDSVSEAAARASKFSPTLKNGVAVKVSGIIVYNFTAR